MKYALAIALLVVGSAHAQGFAPLQLSDTGDVCYSWEGGHKSSGSYSRCNPVGYVKPARVVVTPVPSPQIAPSPIMMPMTCAPPPKPVLKKKHRPAPKKC